MALLNEMDALKGTMSSSAQKLENTLKDELNRRRIGGEVFQANGILQDVRDVHQEMMKVLNDRGGGSIPGLDASNDANDDAEVTTGNGSNRRTMFLWGGLFDNVPRGFKLPTMNIQTLMTYWFVGSKHPRVPPLQYVKAYDFPNEKAMKVRLSQMKTMMKHVKRAAELVNFDFTDLRWSVEKTTRLYEATENYFRFPAVHHRRFTDITWKTVFLLLQKNKFKLVGEV